MKKTVLLMAAMAFTAAAVMAQTSLTQDRMQKYSNPLDRRGPAAVESPSGATAPARVTAAQTGLPWPLEGHQFTLTELNRYGHLVKGQVVWVKLAPTSIPVLAENGMYKVFVRDPKADGLDTDHYSFVYFPKEGAEKLGLLRTTLRNAMSFYVKVGEDQLTAVARSKRIEMTGAFTYVW